ncbi:MAG: hypothetical protein H6815_01785 [Phycisphaeraceae bacterium]|nr:hypothetical protein [Phycisphaerales bacterium]MCB9859159.1 hypothetical protein [Phycisphaeraceae bacterium]
MRTLVVTALAIFATLGVAFAALATGEYSSQPDDVKALDGDWIFVEDRTEGRPVEKHQPSMSTRVRLRVEDDALVLVRSNREIRIPLDGSPTEVAWENSASLYSGQWKDNAFTYQSEPVGGGGLIRWELRITEEGMIATVMVDPPDGFTSSALYRHPEDIEMPAPAKAKIDDMAWLTGAWVGTSGSNGTTSIEERWTPPLGGAMLAVSRTVLRDRLRAFEYLRIVERDEGLVYIAQPNGRPPTEFILTEIGTNRAVFENPRHDSPQRIVYERSAEGGLTASIGYANGGTPRRFEFGPEGK